MSSRTRHGMEIKIKTGVKKDGTIISQDMQVIINAGAYAGGTMSIVWAMSGKFFKTTRRPISGSGPLRFIPTLPLQAP